MSEKSNLNKKRHQIELYQQQNSKISKALENEKEKIQESINQNKNINYIKNLKLIQQHQQKKCQYCDFQGISNQVYLHIKHMHKEEFLEQTKDKNKYKQCEVCKKILKSENLEQHQTLCNIKKNSKEGAKAKNLMRRMQMKQFQGVEIEKEKWNEFYDSLLSEIGIANDNQLNFLSSQNSTFENEQKLQIQISNSELFKPIKKSKRNSATSTIYEQQEEISEEKQQSVQQPNSDNLTLSNLGQQMNEIMNLSEQKSNV